ncbi:MAG: hypothetical protein H7222_10010 [Methylotenera sp.]|nr:hypothetical protein [Oligoflexia bacterium]
MKKIFGKKSALTSTAASFLLLAFPGWNATAETPDETSRPPIAKWNLDTKISDSIFSKRAIRLDSDIRLSGGARVEQGSSGNGLGESAMLDDDHAVVQMEYPTQPALPDWYIGLWVRPKKLDDEKVRVLLYFSDHSWIGMTSKSFISFNPEADENPLRYQEQAHGGLVHTGEAFHFGVRIFTHEGVRSLSYIIDGTPLSAASTSLRSIKVEEKEEMQATVDPESGEAPPESFSVKTSRPKVGFDPMTSDREPGRAPTLFDFGTGRVISKTFIGNPALPIHRLDLLSGTSGRRAVSGTVDELKIYSLNHADSESLWFAEFSCNVAMGTLVDVAARTKEIASPQLAQLRKLAQKHGMKAPSRLGVCEQYSLGPDDTEFRRNTDKLCTSTTARRATLQGELEDRCLRKKIPLESLK